LLKLIETGEEDSRIVALVIEILKFPFTPAVKALLAHRQKDPTWLNVRPPLETLSEAGAARLADAYDGIVA
jgi:4-hydroxy-tetrahydrodipicolinate synthase